MSRPTGTEPSSVETGKGFERRGDEVCAAGQLVRTGTPVVLWQDSGGYDAYLAHCHFQPDQTGPVEHPDRVMRYDPLRKGLPEGLSERIRENGWSLDDLKEVLTQVVVHYDACGTSKRCFKVLHDIRGLSCHFLLDLDGTIYQTLDIQERAWHAGIANDHSIGIEIANVGAYPDDTILKKWYGADRRGMRVTFPEEYGETGLPPEFVPRPRKPEPVTGRIHGKELMQYDFTEEQYRAVGKLLSALCRTFPKIRPRFPSGKTGQLQRVTFASDQQLQSFEGILGHWHVTERKVDPGPAFDWARIFSAAKAPRRF